MQSSLFHKIPEGANYYNFAESRDIKIVSFLSVMCISLLTFAENDYIYT